MTSEPDISVLYANDDVQLLELVSSQLTAESDRLAVHTAQSVDRAEEILAAEPIDCILSDYHMPEQNGIDFLRQVRLQYPDLPFLLFTETGNEAVASESIDAGVTDYIIQETIGNQAALLVRKITTHVEHRRSQREIEDTNRRLREIANVTDQVLWVFSPDWSELRFHNGGHKALFGQSIETLRGRPTAFLDQVHDDDTERVKMAMEQVSTGDSVMVEYRVNKSPSVQVWVESRCRPVTDESGSVVSLVGFSRDITDRKVHQRELVEKTDQLEEFTSTVAHDLRNPLNVADGNLRIAATDHESTHLDTALEAIKRMDDRIEELLSLAREGKQAGEKQYAEFAELVTASYENLHVPGSSLSVESTTTLYCDPARVIEAFENLVRNATEHGPSSVTITAGVLENRPGVYLEDDGPGIPPAEREQIFEKGYTTREDGSGFGLPIVKRIVDAHDWEIQVRESPPGGARFEILFPPAEIE